MVEQRIAEQIEIARRIKKNEEIKRATNIVSTVLSLAFSVWVASKLYNKDKKVRTHAWGVVRNIGKFLLWAVIWQSALAMCSVIAFFVFKLDDNDDSVYYLVIMAGSIITFLLYRTFSKSKQTPAKENISPEKEVISIPENYPLDNLDLHKNDV